MRRGILVRFVVLSVPGVMAVTLWARSYRPVAAYFALGGGGGGAVIAQSSYGWVWLQSWTGVVPRPGWADGQDIRWVFGRDAAPTAKAAYDVGYTFPVASLGNGFGFHWSEFGSLGRRGGAAYRMWLLSVPYWAIVAGCAVMPLAYGGKELRRWRRRVRGMCPGCGYDVRATPERCPESGELIGGRAGSAGA